MIRTIDITLNAAHPELPLLEATTYVGSPSAIKIHGVPPSVGAWRINAVRVVATYPDNSAHTVAAVLAAGDTWVATIPATDTSGRVEQGLQIVADGTDERGESVTGYVLGIAGFAVYLRDMTIESATGVKYYIHLLDDEPAEPKEGDAYLDGTTLNIYHDGAWSEIAGGSVELDNSVTRTSTNGVKSSGIWSAIWGALTALPTGFASLYDWVVSQLAGKLGNMDVQTLNGILVVNGIDTDRVELYENGGLDTIGLTGSGLRNPNDDNVVISWPSLGSSDTLALLSQIYAAVQQIAPDFTAKAYSLNELCSYNGIVYRCKLAYTADAQSTKPNADSTHWEAKKVSELFLPLTGGEVHDITVHTPGSYHGSIELYTDGVDGPHVALKDNDNQYIFFLYSDRIITHGRAIMYPVAPGDLALLQNLAGDFLTSSTYAINDLCVYNNRLYRCTTAHQGAWDNFHFAIATVQDVLTAIWTALDNKAPLASPAFTGTPTAPTPASGDNSTKVATTAFVQGAVAGATPNLDYVMRVDPETGGIYYTTPDNA